MVVVIFRSRLKPQAAQGYPEIARQMADLAAQAPGFVSFKTFSAPDGERVSLIEFDSEEALAQWRFNPEHLAAQKQGREEFYQEYRVQVCRPIRDYGSREAQGAAKS